MVDIKAIYASKLFKSSNRQDSILLAYKASISNKLSVQPPESVDRKYRNLTVRPEADKEDAEGVDTSDRSNNSSVEPPSHSGGSYSGGGSHSSFSSDPADLPSSDDLVDVPDENFLIDDSTDSTEATPADAEPTSDDSIQEATDLGLSVNNVLDLDTLKEQLNDSEKASGVSRIKQKDSELWVYYSDDVNLNNVMVDTIDIVQDSIDIAEFNRLARSDNAVVFQLSERDTDES